MFLELERGRGRARRDPPGLPRRDLLVVEHGVGRREVLGTRAQALVAHEDPGAGVPPEDRVLVSGGPELLRLLVPAHRLLEPGAHDVAEITLLQARLRPTLADD